MEEVKKYLSSNMPRGVDMYLFDVTRETVELVHLDRVGDRLEVERTQVLHAIGEEAVLLADDLLGRPCSMVRARWSRLLTSQFAVCRHSSR